MGSLLQDIRYSVRLLARARSFTATAILTMAVGIGANVTVFNFVSALLFRPAPGVADPHSLLAIYTSDFSSGPYGDSSYPDYESLRALTGAFDSMAIEYEDAGVVRVGEFVERVRVSAVSGSYFDLLGLKPAAGRLFTDADTDPAAAPIAVISHSLWKRGFDGSPTALGATLTLNGRHFTIVGIAPARFAGLDLGRSADIWTPLLPPSSTPDERGNRGFGIVARLAPGVTLNSAQAQVSSVAVRLAEHYPETNRGTLAAPDEPRPIIVVPHTWLPPAFRAMVSTLGAVLMTAVGLVLLIACANIASLLLSRATARDREMAVRLALGAARTRLIRQLLTESLLLGLCGGALGLLFSLWTSELLPSFFPAEQARLLDTRLDARAFAFVLGISVLSSILFGLAPALQAAGPGSAAALRSGTIRVSESRTRSTLRRLLVAGQVAVAVVLLIAAALLTRSLTNALAADPGFAARNAVLATIELPHSEFTPEQGLGYYASALERARSLRGVEAASVAHTLPTSRPSRRGFQMEGYDPQPGEDTELPINVVGGQYFETLRIPLIAGRTFDARDRRDGHQVAIVNELLAARYFGGSAVGRRVTDSSGAVLEIVGVVGNTVGVTIQSPPVPMVYYPLDQSYVARMTVVARTAGDAHLLVETIRRELTAVNRSVPVFRALTLSAHMAESSADSRLTVTLVATCGVMALLLATIGVYGVIAYAVARRTREIGVRLALGARPRHIVRLVIGEGLGVTCAGVLFGLVGAAIATRLLKSLLYGVTPSDPLTYLLVPLVLAIVALIAACAPARRALRVEPNTVLRQE